MKNLLKRFIGKKSDKEPTQDQIDMQRFAYAVKACRMLGYAVEKTAKALTADVDWVQAMYDFDDEDLIDWESGTY